MRQSGPGRFREGILARRKFLPLTTYLERSAVSTTQPAEQPWPRAPLKGGAGIFLELDEPLEVIPRELDQSGPIRSATPIRYFNYAGRLVAHGTLTRIAEIEGFEDVECPAGRFEGCLRVRVDLTVHFPWRAAVELRTYLWLSPEVGEVRRVQHISGVFLIFWFADAYDYRLVSYRPAKPEGEPARPPRWARGAILLDRIAPYPRIAGMVVDFAAP